MVSFLQIVLLALGIAKIIIFAHFILSWLINFQVLNLRQPVVAQIWYGLQRVLEPIYEPIRRFLPQMGGVDLSPLVALFAIYAVEIIIRNNLPAFV
ncbi:YggT family protein [Aestuariibius sp. 2305UL40-4]|uniref:YggT family protein n=1 Tax=Aestuariibius violaceus TaxID=3234132 RepID=UPI00345E6009